eukprot:Opistho-1_new@2671
MADADENGRRFSDEYELKEQLGKGAFSVVRLCTNRRSNREFAVKIVDMRRMPEKDKPKVLQEASICRMLKHPNICRLEDTILTQQAFYMVFELVSGGELFDDIVRRTYYSERDASRVMRQIFSAVEHIHVRNIIHRDLKPENLLLESSRPGANLKVTDFGLAVQLANNSEAEWFGFSGTPGYISPEVLKRVPYGKAVDMWACGVILYILLAGYPPFWHEDRQKLYSLIILGEYDYPSPDFDDVTPAARDLIDKLLTGDPAQRLSIQEALNHPWIAHGDRVASEIHRQGTIEELRRFNARQKFKGAVLTAIAGSRLTTVAGSPGSRSNPDLPKAVNEEQAAASGVPPTSPGKVPVINVNDAAPGGQPSSSGSTLSVGAAMSHSATIVAAGPGTGEKQAETEVLLAAEKLLACISRGDWDAYRNMCDPSLTAFEPEAVGELVQGMDFHKFYFDGAGTSAGGSRTQATVKNARVRVMGDVAVHTATRLVQSHSATSGFRTRRYEETRVWRRVSEGPWKMVHFHRSDGGSWPH